MTDVEPRLNLVKKVIAGGLIYCGQFVWFAKMESTAQRNDITLERVVSSKALKMGNSFSCQICVAGFLSGVCLTYFFLRLEMWSLEGFHFCQLPWELCLRIHQVQTFLVNWNSSSHVFHFLPDFNLMGLRAYILLLIVDNGKKDAARKLHSQKKEESDRKEKIMLLYSAWTAMLNKSEGNIDNEFWSKLGLNISQVPKAPHLENCKSSAQVNKFFDIHRENEQNPDWENWEGLLRMKIQQENSTVDSEQAHAEKMFKSKDTYPPWISGSDEDNFPLTRKVQHDIWIHQHPLNCSDPILRFLVADWETKPGFGIGAQLAGMIGFLAIAINEKRILVTNYFNRADHDGCKGRSRSNWSCYFFPETSLECRDPAFDLMKRQEAWDSGTVTGKHNYRSKDIWAGRIPKVWGDPWLFLQPTTEINGSLVRHHRKMDRRWWRAQAIRYLMRFQTDYTCDLLNVARHTEFGIQAAEMVLESLPGAWPEAVANNPLSDMEEYVWREHKPWIPRPLLSMHVRIGDKACEMKVVGFEEYMRLADRIRKRFPNLKTIWLSTEMQDDIPAVSNEVIDKSMSYPNWKFHYTNITRQVGNTSMASYEASLGRKTSSNYPLVNFLMATEADFFIGALGSTWCFLIDGMRNTGGKVMAGYLSVNRDRFW
ncbi:hypothetical protein C5167_034079 [Papaver somniferum]|uniref:Alpha-(1,6)-fucosyltransferase n=1 Tax=Papaver somniferum TaxID=3469 RepID=A0A4Y7K9L1_PAPSO|nr:hypothetical protein C5167_034079 [Papaver somniferum]